jgi:uncharacterized membrane protein YbaN (DUF454 family)
MKNAAILTLAWILVLLGIVGTVLTFLPSIPLPIGGLVIMGVIRTGVTSLT